MPYSTECPVKITESIYLKPWSTIGNSSSRGNGVRMHKSLFDSTENDAMIAGDPCVRRFQLVRVKQLQTFSGVYLFQVLFIGSFREKLFK